MNKILSIDIGIKNLAFCCASTTNKKEIDIWVWQVRDTLADDNYICESLRKNGNVCGSKTSFVENEVYTCKTHASSVAKAYKRKLVSSYTQQQIAKAIISEMEKFYEEYYTELSGVKQILIELQPKVNPKAVFASHIIYGWLTQKYMESSIVIKFVRASQKLKAYTGLVLECQLKGAYAKRKWLGIQYARHFLEEKVCDRKDHWTEYFDQCPKQDDLSDALLMVINGLCGVPKKNN